MNNNQYLANTVYWMFMNLTLKESTLTTHYWYEHTQVLLVKHLSPQEWEGTFPSKKDCFTKDLWKHSHPKQLLSKNCPCLRNSFLFIWGQKFFCCSRGKRSDGNRTQTRVLSSNHSVAWGWGVERCKESKKWNRCKVTPVFINSHKNDRTSSNVWRGFLTPAPPSAPFSNFCMIVVDLWLIYVILFVCCVSAFLFFSECMHIETRFYWV